MPIPKHWTAPGKPALVPPAAADRATCEIRKEKKAEAERSLATSINDDRSTAQTCHERAHRENYAGSDRHLNGWSIRFRVIAIEQSEHRPYGIKYSFTPHDVDGTRLLGFDNAHGLPRRQPYDHRHPFRKPQTLVPYEFRGADELICDFFAAVEGVCEQVGVASSSRQKKSTWIWRATMTRKSLTELREEMRSVALGGRRAAPLPAGPLMAALSGEALELLGILLRQRPGSVNELVALTGRAQPNVSRSLQLLASLGLVRLARVGREVRPEPIAASVRVDLATGTYETTPASGAAA